MNSPRNRIEILDARDDAQLTTIAELAYRICHEHYPAMISGAQIDYMLERGYSLPRLRSESRELGIRFWLALCDRQPAGFAAAGPDEQDPGFWLHKLYVDKPYRGRDIARRLMTRAAAYADEQQTSRIRLRVNRGNTLALTVYDRLGFKKSRCDVKNIGSGFVMDDYLLSLERASWPGGCS